MDDPRYQRYVDRLVECGISKSTARRAARVRIEGEDRIAARLDSYDKHRAEVSRKNMGRKSRKR